MTAASVIASIQYQPRLLGLMCSLTCLRSVSPGRRASYTTANVSVEPVALLGTVHTSSPSDPMLHSALGR